MNIKVSVRNFPTDRGNVLFALVETDGRTFGFTRYADEKEWLCDSLFRGWQPVFVHGIGSRCCIKRVATGEIKAALDATLQLALR